MQAYLTGIDYNTPKINPQEFLLYETIRYLTVARRGLKAPGYNR
jgi:hypothetical protein